MKTKVWTVSECSWKNYPLAVVGDAVYVICNGKNYCKDHLREAQNKVSGF